ncbi:ATP-binding cassette domain-containing protein [Pokkaliibacter sp. MBI-7]|uniref:ATP-binding cassette domain-containing protein n=1 Tax=Pokkaliibacter sp. MBI-7 TaxID=3040600 RepID=UPI002449573C|nr:ATP-binding cassette domain-containing protein [Pokkaliibacter sp. MBI-7]MDH2434340.1 ATP-binding cassette domain-containing protein [Pokkaliibacter sp. MBI-7]
MTSALTSGLQLQGVTLSVAEHLLCLELSLQIGGGELLALMGPSGCGKSTLLAWITGTLNRSFSARGILRLGGAEVHHLPPERRRIGLLQQDDLLFPHLNVHDNLLLAVPRHYAQSERHRRVGQALQQAELADMAGRDPLTLSGGQRARVSLMRTLLAEPLALLLDEPFNRLDQALREQMRQFVYGHLRDSGLPTLLVTHDPQDIPAGATVLHWPMVSPTEGAPYHA